MSGSGSRRCCFCGSAKDITNEDIWPKWCRPLLEVKGADHGGTVWTSQAEDGTRTVRRAVRSKPLSLHTVKKVCRRCNNEWMSDIENAAKKVLAPMVLGEPRQLRSSQRASIANWAYLKGLVIAVAEDQFTSTEPLEEFRENPVAPKSCSVIAGHYVGFNHPLYAAAGPQKLNVRIGDDFRPRDNVSFVATIGIGQFVAHVYDPGIKEAIELRPKGWRELASVPVWPIMESSVSWPPWVRLTDKTIHDFTTEVAFRK